MKYYVTYRIDARYIARVNADSLEEAKEKAQAAWESADFGEASDIDGDIVLIKDEAGNYWVRSTSGWKSMF